MSNLIVKQQLQAIQLSDFMRLTYITLDNDTTESIQFTKDGIICPIGMTTSEKTFSLAPIPNRVEKKTLQEEINDALSFFKFLKYKEIDGTKNLYGEFRINSGRVFNVLIWIPPNYPNTSPTAMTKFDILKDCTFYHQVKQTRTTYSTFVSHKRHLIDFVAETVAYLNKKECYMTFNIWLGAKVSSTTKETL